MLPVSALCDDSAVSDVMTPLIASGITLCHTCMLWCDDSTDCIWYYLVSHMYVVACREVEAGYLQRRQQQRQIMLLASAAGPAPLAPSSMHLRWFAVFNQSYFSPSIIQTSSSDAHSICKSTALSGLL